MAPPPGRLGGAVKLPVHVRMCPAAFAAVDAFAAALRQQRSGAAFSRAEALRIAAMEWRVAYLLAAANAYRPTTRCLETPGRAALTPRGLLGIRVYV